MKPVITIVIYWGADKWDGARSLHELLDVPENSAMRTFVNDYRMPVIVPNEINHELFRTELKEILLFVANSNDKAMMKELIEHTDGLKKFSGRAIKVLNEVTHLNISAEEGEMIDVCKAWEDWKEEGREEGRSEGQEGEKVATALRLLKAGRDVMVIKEATELPEERIEELKSQLN